MSDQIDKTVGPSTGNRVFVDAKIIGRHDVALPKRTFVGYAVDGREDIQKVTEVEGVDETDEAELEAVAFAIRDLKGVLPDFTILCDNESVVLEMQRGERRRRSRRVLEEIQNEIKASNSRIRVELLSNPADKLLNRHVAELNQRTLSD